MPTLAAHDSRYVGANSRHSRALQSFRRVFLCLMAVEDYEREDYTRLA